MRVPLRLPWRLGLAVVALTILHACQDVSITAVEVVSVTLSPAQTTLVVGDTVRLSATPRDQNGAALQDRSVTWSTQDASVATVNDSGLVEARSVGETAVHASAGGAQGSASIQVRERPELVVSHDRVELSGVAGGGQAATAAIDVASEGGAPVSGLTAQVSYGDGVPSGWLTASLQGSQTPTTLALQASAGGLGEGVYRAEVTVAAPSAGSTARIDVEFTVSDAPPVIGLSTAAVGFVWEEDQPLPPSQSVQVTNAGGGVLTGLGVDVSYAGGAATGWLAAELEGSAAPTALVLEVDPTDLEVGVQDAFVDVRSQGATNSPQTIRVRLTVGEPPPELELIPGQVGWTVVEDDPLPPPVQVEILNRGGGELGGISASVSYTSGAPGGWLDLELGQTEAPSSMSLALNTTDLPTGTYQAQVRVESPDAINSPQMAAVTLEVRPRASAADSEISTDPTTLPADGASTAQVTVTLRDARGDRIPFGGAEVGISTTAGTLGEVVDRDDGSYTATLTASTSADTAVLTARVNGEDIADQATVEFTVGAVSASESSLTADPESGLTADGSDASTVTAVLRDQHGNSVVGLTSDAFQVSLSSESGAAQHTAVTETATAGTYTFDVTNTTAEQVTVTLTADGVTLDDQPVITFVAGSVSAERSSVSVDPDTVVADGDDTSLVTVRLRDVDNNRVEGLTDENFQITLASDAGTATRTPVSEESPPPGTYRFRVSNTTAEDVTVIVTVDGVTLNDQPEITFVAGPIVSIRIVSGDGQSGTVGEALDEPLVVEVTNLLGLPVPGAGVSWTPADGDGSADPTSSLTGIDGRASTSWTLGPDAGQQSLTARADALDESVTFTAEAEAGSVSAETSSVHASPTTGITADGQDASLFSLEVRDEEDNEVTGLSDDDFDIDVQGASPSTVTETAPGSGEYTFELTHTVAETVDVLVAARGTTLADPTSVTFVAGEAAALVVVQQPTNTEVDEPISPAVAVEIVDAEGNRVRDSTLEVTITIGEDPSDPENPATLGGTTQRNAIDGLATFDDLTVDRPGDGYTLIANADGLGPAESATFDVTPAP